MTSNERHAVSYAAYEEALSNARTSGKLSDYQVRVLSQLGLVVRMLVDNHVPNTSPAEVLALLTLAQEFGAIILGAIDSAKNEKTPFGYKYRNAVSPVMLDLLDKGVVDEGDLPYSDEIKKLRARHEVAEQAAEAV